MIRPGGIPGRAVPVIVLTVLLIPLLPTDAQQPEDRQIWREFTAWLQAGEIGPERIRPLNDAWMETFMGHLRNIAAHVDWNEMEAASEFFRVGEKLHVLVELSYEGAPVTYCFSFLITEQGWFYHHLEAIQIRLDRTGEPPVSDFPDVPEQTKNWMRNERFVSNQIWLYNQISREKGREQALWWFLDGPGYAVNAQTWVPFVEPARAFILFFCWDQAKLWGDAVVLEKLADDEAVVRIHSHVLEMYERTAHLKTWLPEEEYRGFWEAIWRNRAEASGWGVEITYEDTVAVFRFTRRR